MATCSYDRLYQSARGALESEYPFFCYAVQTFFFFFFQVIWEQALRAGRSSYSRPKGGKDLTAVRATGVVPL